MKTKLQTLFYAASMLMLSINAHAITMDFSTAQNLSANSKTYIEDGYQLTTTANKFFLITTKSDGALSGLTYNQSTTLKNQNNELFSLLSIDLASYYVKPADPVFNITFTGIKADNSTVQSTFSVGNSYQTFSFTDFSNLVSVTWSQGSNSKTLHQFDNIVVKTGATAVPEPETYAMMLIGLGLIGFSARRKLK